MLVRLAHEYEKSGLKIAGIALDENGRELIKTFVADYKIDYPILIPPANSPFLSLENLPTTLLIDTEGRLARKYIGAIPEKTLREDIESLIRKTGGANRSTD
jgi:hypothetical protein